MAHLSGGPHGSHEAGVHGVIYEAIAPRWLTERSIYIPAYLPENVPYTEVRKTRRFYGGHAMHLIFYEDGYIKVHGLKGSIFSLSYLSSRLRGAHARRPGLSHTPT